MRAPHIVTRALISVLVGLALAAGLQAPPAEASNASKVKALLSKIGHSKNPKATYTKMSKANKALVKKELGKGHNRGHWRPILNNLYQANPMPDGSTTRQCWARAYYTEYLGGISNMVQFTTSNTTEVCVESGIVDTVRILDSYIDVTGLLWHPDKSLESTLNMDWEGRGMVRGLAYYGANGWVLFHRSNCAQVRLNSDLSHYLGDPSCAIA